MVVSQFGEMAKLIENYMMKRILGPKVTKYQRDLLNL
jgi:hypothetical protein